MLRIEHFPKRLEHVQCAAGEAVPVSKGPQILAHARSSTVLGGMLWQRHASGVRVICRGKAQTVAGFDFEGYGSSCDRYPHDYMTAAAALGASKRDIDSFVDKVRRCWPSVEAPSSEQAAEAV